MIEKIIEEYQADELKDDENIFNLKKWIDENLTLQEKRVLTLYAEYASMRKVAKLLNCSHSSVNNYIKEIREKIKNGYSKKSNTINNNSDISN